MPESTRLRIALIGLGDIARKAYLPLMAAYPDVDPVLCTRQTEVLSRLADRYRIAETYASLDELLARPPAAAMVHAATDSHVAITLRLLEAGIPVFVDKPLSYSLEGADRIVAAARDKDVPLFVGFNRRYAPLIRALRDAGTPLHIHWQKNRTALPGDPRTFVFDDFIHVVDGLRFLAPGPVENLRVHAHYAANQLANLQVHWTQGDILLTGGMNRIAGRTEERIEYFTDGHTWRLDNLHAGSHYHAGEITRLGFDHWEPTLTKRGFSDMLDAWIATVRSGCADAAMLEDVRLTHALCEDIVERLRTT
ncbi:Gfo/Idh/MocA family protein [Lewinella sp. JB7]|uniref:Gfo/Idh/MocA family protein n=1 Tax=Lewinella sp. JB7 TaxID=2962887 RepID=UPI0020C982EA|nr:Gfo/Idh/MocA family oxidoreductase [Lewinella sp. JB7]MCP9234629.1 Gfo/Idh/MocA family oxidoreductase [Lewinella sp. JB7]